MRCCAASGHQLARCHTPPAPLSISKSGDKSWGESGPLRTYIKSLEPCPSWTSILLRSAIAATLGYISITTTTNLKGKVHTQLPDVSLSQQNLRRGHRLEPP